MLQCLPTEVHFRVVLVPKAGWRGADYIHWDPQLGSVNVRLIFVTV